MDFPFQTGNFPPGRCHFGGKFNLQALTCYHRQNLKYKPQFGHGQFGQSPQVVRSHIMPQALMLTGNPGTSCPPGLSYAPSPAFAQNFPPMTSFGSGYTSNSSGPSGVYGESAPHEISHNLLFVHNFALDNNCRIIFFSSGYLIQDKFT